MALTEHSPAHVVQQLMLDRSAAGSVPVYRDGLPDEPDTVVSVRDREVPDYVRLQPTGAVAGRRGLLITVRAANDGAANQLAVQLFKWMSETVYHLLVRVDSKEYLVHCFSGIGRPIPEGKDKNNTRRSSRTMRVHVDITEEN